jgi:hypothetical protein
MACYLYIIAVGGDGGPFKGPVKIGMSNNPQARLQDIRPCSPLGLGLAHIRELPNRIAARRLEMATHNILREHHLDYEWFGVDVHTAIDAIEEASA